MPIAIWFSSLFSKSHNLSCRGVFPTSHGAVNSAARSQECCACFVAALKSRILQACVEIESRATRHILWNTGSHVCCLGQPSEHFQLVHYHFPGKQKSKMTGFLHVPRRSGRNSSPGKWIQQYQCLQSGLFQLFPSEISSSELPLKQSEKSVVCTRICCIPVCCHNWETHDTVRKLPPGPNPMVSSVVLQITHWQLCLRD